MSEYIDILFDRHPATRSGDCKFIEVEDDAGKSIKAGEWVEREKGMVALRISTKAEEIAKLRQERDEWRDRLMYQLDSPLCYDTVDALDLDRAEDVEAGEWPALETGDE